MSTTSAATDPVVIITQFTAKPGQLDAFIALQQTTLPGLSIPGLRGGRLHRAEQGEVAVLVSVFESAEHADAWGRSEAFARHRERLLPLLERSQSARYRCEYESGDWGRLLV